MSDVTALQIFGPDEYDRVAHQRRVATAMEHERAKREARQRLDSEAQAAVELPEPCTLRHLLTAGVPAVEWRIERWMPKGANVMILALAKTGKSTLRNNLIRCLVDGDPWLDVDLVRPISGAVVVFDLEMSSGQGLSWANAHDIQNDDRVIIFHLRGNIAALDWRDPLIRARWAALLRPYRPEVLVLDCVRPWLDAFGLSEHTDGGQLTVAIDALKRDADIPESVTIHHTGHTGERVRGDSRLQDWPDVQWLMTRQGDDPSSQRFIRAYGRDVSIEESALVYDAETRRLGFTGGSRRDSRARDVLADVLALLRSGEAPLSVRGIQRALEDSDHARDQIRAAIKLGVRDGNIVATPGARGAVLHQACERSAPCDEHAAHGASERAAAYIEPHARTLIGEEDDRPFHRTVIPFNPDDAFRSVKAAP